MRLFTDRNDSAPVTRSASGLGNIGPSLDESGQAST
jgi:hypothetical protein